MIYVNQTQKLMIELIQNEIMELIQNELIQNELIRNDEFYLHDTKLCQK